VPRERARRVEAGLDHELVDRPDIGPAERVALRAQARAVDMAEAAHDPELVSKANGVYLDLRQAAGLVAGSGPVADSFGDLMASLGRPAASLRHSAD
jgi:hypothetical protein